MRAVNLLPRESHGRKRLRRVDPVLAGGAVLTAVVLGAVGAGFVLSHSRAASESSRLAAARAELAQLEAQHPSSGAPATPPLSQPAAASQEGSWRIAVDTALVGRIPWDGVLADLARVVPAKVTVSSVTLGETTAGTASTSGASATSLTLGGNAFSQEGIAQLLSRLQLMPGLSQVALTSSSADPKTGVLTFAISANVAIAVPAAPSAPGGTA